MLHTKTEREELEEHFLAPYALRSRRSRGRRYEQPPHPCRPEFQRDRDRVIHSRSFRRLEYKTQVFVNGTADHYRTRLTHTIEMAAVGRTIARVLRVNEDLTEAIALAHDLGHSPFGHSGEEALDELMKNENGFDHNLQSCRCVELLEMRYPDFPGLNLTWEVRAGLRKHQAAVPGVELDGCAIGPFQSMEAQIADVADDLTYHAHDVDDAIEAQLIGVEELNKLELWREVESKTRRQYPVISDDDCLRISIRNLLDIQVMDVLETSVALIRQHAPDSPHAVMNAPERLVSFSPRMKRMLEPFRAFLFQNIYWTSNVSDANMEAVRMMRKLFLYYVENPRAMGRKARARIEQEGLWRTACDYVAGMTDRYAMEECLAHGLN